MQKPPRLSLLLAIVLPLLVSPAFADFILVDNTTCTLVDAFDAANTDSAVGGCSAGSGPDTVVLRRDVSLNVVNNHAYGDDTGLPVVVSEIRVEGRRFTIGRHPLAPPFRLLAVAASGTLTLHDVDLQNGEAAGQGGSIFNFGTTHLYRSSLSGNSADTGGAIRNLNGIVTLANTTLSDNEAIRDGGAILSGNAGASVTLSNSTVSGNSAGNRGGGIMMQGGVGTLVMTHTTVSGNSAEGYGGGIYATDSYVELTDSTVSGNSTGDGFLARGGGISARNASVSLTSTTVSGNSAPFAGGMYFSQGLHSLTNTTVSGNSADSWGGIVMAWGYLSMFNSTVSANLGGGLFHDYGGDGDQTQLWRSIVSNNGGANCAGEIVNRGNNFADDGTCPGFGMLTGLDPVLDDNGGPTKTHALLPSSPAIDAAGDCVLESDQRGQPRSDDSCDSGSYEFQCSIAVAEQQGETLIVYSPAWSGFDVVTGLVSELLAAGGFGAATCLGTFVASPATDFHPAPLPGDARYYLARGHTSCVGTGYGQSPLTPDPRDGLLAGPCP